MTLGSALHFALFRMLQVLWGGAVAAGFYAGLIILGPKVEGTLFPVSVDYQFLPQGRTDDGGVSFLPVFRKVRDCAYLGTSWYTTLSKGDPIGVQAQIPDLSANSRVGGPLGPRSGPIIVIYPPPGAESVFGLMHHNCGLPWQTTTALGPFKL